MQTYLVKRLGKTMSNQDLPEPNRVDSKKVTSNYGKWYLEPKQFNSTMNLYKTKMLKDQVEAHQVSQELMFI